MRTARPLYQPRTKSIDQQKLELDRSKHVHQILQTHEARFGQILTWLFTSQGLLGAAYAYLKSQVAASQALNRVESFKAARGLLQAFPYFASLPAGPSFWLCGQLQRRTGSFDFNTRPIRTFSRTSSQKPGRWQP